MSIRAAERALPISSHSRRREEIGRSFFAEGRAVSLNRLGCHSPRLNRYVFRFAVRQVEASDQVLIFHEGTAEFDSQGVVAIQVGSGDEAGRGIEPQRYSLRAKVGQSIAAVPGDDPVDVGEVGIACDPQPGVVKGIVQGTEGALVSRRPGVPAGNHASVQIEAGGINLVGFGAVRLYPAQFTIDIADVRDPRGR